jgi:hypothetical protein
VAETKIDDDGPARLIHEDIGALEIFVRDVERVEGVDDLEKGAEEADKMTVLPRCSVRRSGLGIQSENDISGRVSIVPCLEIIAADHNTWMVLTLRVW